MVTQRTDHDCVFCCLAMALGISYEQAAERAGGAFMEMLKVQGCSDALEKALMRAFGLEDGKDFVERKYSPHWGSVHYTKALLWGRRALITARSKNIPDGWHMVYWDGDALHDPRQAERQRYTDWNDIEPVEITIFNESRSLP